MSIKENIQNGNLILTTACPVECAHCVFMCKHYGKWMPEGTIENVVKNFAENNIQNIHISGGEPFYNISKLARTLEIIRNYYSNDRIGIITSGFWADNKNITKKILEIVSPIGLLEVSTDRFHIKRVSLAKIANVLSVANQMNIKILLRICLDAKSEFLIKPLAEIINNYKLSVHVFSLDFKGRAIKLDKELNKNFVELKNRLLLDVPKENETGFEREKFQNSLMRLSPVVFPNGNTYACCDGIKLTYIGNINKEEFSSILSNWMCNPMSALLLPNGSNCPQLGNLISPKCKHFCDFCMDNPLTEKGKWGKEFVGRQYIRLFPDRLNSHRHKFSNPNREYLIAFQIRQNDLMNRTVGKKILIFLNYLKRRDTFFKLSRPLPPCLFNTKQYENLLKNFDAPKNCFECRELFSVEKNLIKFCDGVKNKKDNVLGQFKNREEMYRHFKTEHNNLKTSNLCKNCLFRIRSQCNGMCLKL